jgi:hypothetical protein
MVNQFDRRALMPGQDYVFSHIILRGSNMNKLLSVLIASFFAATMSFNVVLAQAAAKP